MSHQPSYHRLFLAVIVGLCTAIHAGGAAEQGLDFGELIIGTPATRAVFVTEPVTDETQWRFIRGARAPFSVTSDTPIDVAGSWAFVVGFQPLTKGAFIDTVVIVQMQRRRPVDTIYIALVGSGRSLTQQKEIHFLSTLTGDKQYRSADVYGPAYLAQDYRIDDSLYLPFAIDDTTHVLQSEPDDSLEITVRFQPLTIGLYSDTLTLIRWHQQLPLDTLTYIVRGEAVSMRSDTTLVIRDIVVGNVDTTLMFLRLPSGAVSERFQYDVRCEDEAVLRVVVDPSRPTRRSVVTLKIIANPQEYRNRRIECYLRRHSADLSTSWDSTRLDIDLLMKPRPVDFSLTWQADTIFAAVGDTVQLVLQAVTSTPFDEPIEITGYQLDVAYNPTVLIPLGRPGQRRVLDGDTLWWRMDAAQRSVVPVSGRTVLDTVHAVVALGDAPFTRLVTRKGVIGIRASQPQSIASDTSVVAVTNIFTYGPGTPRLVNPMQGALRIVITPNPSQGTGTILVAGVTEGIARLDIVDLRGSIVATMDNIDVSTNRSISIADLRLEPGHYFAQCIIRRGLTTPPLRTVRMFRIEI